MGVITKYSGLEFPRYCETGKVVKIQEIFMTKLTKLCCTCLSFEMVSGIERSCFQKTN